MNYIILFPEEIAADGRVCLADRRAEHIHAILGAEIGKPVRIGVLNGGRGTGVITANQNNRVVLDCVIDQPPPPEPRVDLILAMPRPLVLKRLWPQLTAMGVRRVILTNANKVERSYFDSHWNRPDYYRQRMIEGLEQTGDTRLPRVETKKRLKVFLEDELDTAFPDSRRMIAHPEPCEKTPPPGFEKHAGSQAPDSLETATVWSTAQAWKFIPQNGERMLIAVGPEGGWTDYELTLFAAHGFERASLGWRVLRTETACVALLALAGMGAGLTPNAPNVISERS